jgi:hypothetical protein
MRLLGLEINADLVAQRIVTRRRSTEETNGALPTRFVAGEAVDLAVGVN